MPSYPPIFASFHQSLSRLLHIPYGDQSDDLASIIVRRVEHFLHNHEPKSFDAWSEQDIYLITYGDSLTEHGKPPLKVLSEFLGRHIRQLISTVHILPYFPYSSDDGFSIIDYLQVNPALGDWNNVRAIAERYRLMTDLVINHVSRESLWFADFVSGIQPGRDYFIEEDPSTDLTMVTRPRNSPLLVPTQTRRGTRHVWATFSEDQIDLNFKNPDVLINMVDIVLFYLARGTSVVRLDAIAFLWKKLNTACVHLPETHAMVKVMRLIIEQVRPGALLITETNVPDPENFSYFARGDEAHLVYQFALPPLILHALNRGTEKYLTHWARALPEYPEGCTTLNFTASHDGIGLRPLEGLVPDSEVAELVDSMHRFGGFVSMRTLQDQSEKPYEINISLFDAMKGTRRGEDHWQAQRFLCSQIIMLGMKGIPAIYIHSLLATPNDIVGVERSGRTRSINRRKWDIEELRTELENPVSMQSMVFKTLKTIIGIRRKERCFHPDCPQQIIDIAPGILAFSRTEPKTGRSLVAIHNLTATHLDINAKKYQGRLDLLSGKTFTSEHLKPYQTLWLVSGTR
ncbi:sugar phosphorylase [Endozoicomonas sp. GU-1]|uniref:sugar phosphorylase n=1 Tax=Endozoicomonas sp. GU-1 TaxID=3009078 RepID=UPI0022B54AF9|nr:sugar phosphorylase [Endozoicomonas sp. GU-1]WBA83791.1 sugar phosphorylase [Endozoicomonas sp. GU-1]WBA86770.1 sugar phosphorylase [Endozoicomonas sp. GU-1]